MYSVVYGRLVFEQCCTRNVTTTGSVVCMRLILCSFAHVTLVICTVLYTEGSYYEQCCTRNDSIMHSVVHVRLVSCTVLYA